MNYHCLDRIHTKLDLIIFSEIDFMFLQYTQKNIIHPSNPNCNKRNPKMNKKYHNPNQIHRIFRKKFNKLNSSKIHALQYTKITRSNRPKI